MPHKIKRLKLFNSKLFESGNFIIVVGFFSILPFLIISIFNNPSADDFCYNNLSRDLGYLNTQFEAYYNWTGRYLSTAILSIRAFVSGAFVVYKSIPVILIILFFVSIYHLCSSIFLYISKRQKYILTFLIMVLYLIQMPSTSQGFYWLAASITYQFAIILSIFLVSFFVKYLITTKMKYLVISMLLSFLAIGLNEISSMFINLIFGITFIYISIKQKKINYPLLSLLVFMCVFSLVVVLSPGSAARATTQPGNQQFYYSMLKTISATKRHLGDWLPTIIIALLIFFEYFNKKVSIKTPEIFKVKLVIPSILVFSFPVIGVFPVYYSLKWVPLRAVNLIYFFFLLGIIYLAFVVYFKLKAEQKNFITLSKWAKYFLFILIVIRLGGNNNIRIAYLDLLSGTAYKYDKELKNRYNAIQNSNNQILVFPELTFMPKTIYFEEIRSNSKHWINQCYKSYFNQKEIILKTNIE